MLRILIPCKPLGEGKSRLDPLLGAAGRRDLCACLLRRTIELANAVAGAEAVHVVAADPEAASIAAAAGVGVIDDPGRGLNAALAHARTRLAKAGMTRLVVLPIDLPGATADALLDVLAEPAAVSIVPDRDGDGTNLLALDATAMTAFEFGYGPASCERHRREAERLGLAARLSPHPLLAMDIDRPEDYRRWIGATEWKRESNKK